eukprot:SAG22_NODE_951_length_6344_cov_2.683747_4_plen_219_part_00
MILSPGPNCTVPSLVLVVRNHCWHALVRELYLMNALGRTLAKLPPTDARAASAAGLFESVLANDPACVHDPTSHAVYNLGLLAAAAAATGDRSSSTKGTAVDYFAKAVSCRPADVAAHSALAGQLYGSRRLAEAAHHFRQASAAVGPVGSDDAGRRALALANLGGVLTATRDRAVASEARDALETALQLNPESAEARRNLAAWHQQFAAEGKSASASA